MSLCVRLARLPVSGRLRCLQQNSAVLVLRTLSSGLSTQAAKGHADLNTIGNAGYRIVQVPIFTDNYAHLLLDTGSGKVAAVDPADPDRVVAALKKHFGHDILDALLLTHKHNDHAGGNLRLADLYGPSLAIYGSAYEECPGVTHPVQAGDHITFGDLSIRVLYTPCHTSGHVQYLISSPVARQPPALFCGDTLFVGGCGRFFEGTAEDMHNAAEQLRGLDPKTLVYCGHEYTTGNLRFATSVDGTNKALADKLAWVNAQRAQNLSTVPSVLGEELQYNPFLRTRSKEIQAAVGASEPVEVMRRLRAMKDQYKG